MNKILVLMIVVLQSGSLFAMDKTNQFGDLKHVDCHNSLDMNVEILPDEVTYRQVPETWQTTCLESLKNVATKDQKQLAFDVLVMQMRRHDNIWQVINMLQAKNPDKVWITVNEKLAKKHPNAFLYFESRCSTIAYLDDLVKKVRAYKASSAKS